MRTYIRYGLTGLLTSLWTITQAQSTPKDTLPIKANYPLTESNLSTLLPQITPKSPTAAALSRYGEYPVSLYTGLPTIEIPIHEFKVGTLIVPIKLTYHASGIKVNDRPSWVGLGWSLQTGGLITRTVLSRPDEQSEGSLGRSIDDAENATFYNPNCPNDDNNPRISALADNNRDSQRDLFSYRTPAGSNTFILTPTAPGYVFLSPESVSLTTTADLGSFTLADASGIRYRFSDGEAIYTNQTGSNPVTNCTSAWHLSEIVSFNNHERAVYSYTSPAAQNGQFSSPEPVDTWVLPGELYEEVTGGSGVTAGLIDKKSADVGTSIATRFPTEIQFPAGKIRFVQATQARSDGSYPLDFIDVFSYEVSSGQYVRVKRYDLVFGNQDGGNNPTGDFLTGLRLIENNASTVIGSYGFAYNTTPLPEKGSRKKDYWGYYNGQSGQTLIATRPFTMYLTSNPGSQQTFTIGDANREPNESLMPAGVLTSISYPTGGLTQFDFETNRYSENNTVKLAGGLRVRQIRSYTAAGQLATTKAYRYGVNESNVGRFRSHLSNTYNSTLLRNYYQPAATGSPKSYSYKVFVFSSSAVYPLLPDEGSPVTYSEVAEYQQDGAGNAIGKTVYQFRDDASDSFLQAGGGKGVVTNRSWDRGQLTRKTVTDANGQLRSRLEQVYQTVASGQSAHLAGALVNRIGQQIGFKVLQSNNCYPTFGIQSDDRYVIRSYLFYYGTTKLTRSQEYTYADDNSGHYTLRTTETDYDPVYILPRETRLLAEGGSTTGNIVLGTRLSYPQDFGSIPVSAATSAELLGIRRLQLRNAYLPVEEVHFRQENPMAPKTYKTARLTTYLPLSNTINGLLTAVPSRMFLMESLFSSFPPNDPYQSSADRYQASGGNTSTFPVDPRFKLRLTTTTYDVNGNLTSFQLTNGPATAYEYQTYTPADGVAFSMLTKETRSFSSFNSQSTTFAYNRPLIGLQSSTDMRGVTTTYEYDGFGRLRTVKDKDGNVLKQYTYRYATQP